MFKAMREYMETQKPEDEPRLSIMLTSALREPCFFMGTGTFSYESEYKVIGQKIK